MPVPNQHSQRADQSDTGRGREPAGRGHHLVQCHLSSDTASHLAPRVQTPGSLTETRRDSLCARYVQISPGRKSGRKKSIFVTFLRNRDEGNISAFFHGPSLRKQTLLSLFWDYLVTSWMSQNVYGLWHRIVCGTDGRTSGTCVTASQECDPELNCSNRKLSGHKIMA